MSLMLLVKLQRIQPSRIPNAPKKRPLNLEVNIYNVIQDSQGGFISIHYSKESAPTRWVERGNNAVEFSVVFNNPSKLEVSGSRSCFVCTPIVTNSSGVTSLQIASAGNQILCMGKSVSISEIRPYIDSRIRL